MGKKKYTPELYELLKKEQIDLSKIREQKEQKDTEEPSKELKQPAIIPLTSPRSTFEARDKLLPKFKSLLQQKTTSLEGNVISLTYTTAIFIMLVVLFALVVSFMLGMHLGRKELLKTKSFSSSANQETLPRPATASPPTPAPQWVIRLVYQDDNPQAQTISNNVLRRLKRDYPNDKFYQDKEIINGKKQICIYVGPFLSKTEAEENLKKWKHKRGYQKASLIQR